MALLPEETGIDKASELAEQLRQVIGRFVRAVRAETGTPTSAQSETLGLIARHGPLSVAAMAGLRNVRHQSMRLVVAQLENAGLVEKRPDPDDGRGRLVALTAQGRTAVESSRRARTAWISDALANRVSEEERQSLRAAISVLDRLIETGKT